MTGAAARVLLTGFVPFGGLRGNPSGDIARALDGARLADGRRVRGLVLPVSFAAAPRRLADALRDEPASLVLCTGLAVSRRELALERVALNLADATLPDNDGAQPCDEPLVAGGPPALFATLPVKRLVSVLREAGHPVASSLSAGSYVCNALFYDLLRRLAGTGIPAGFLHVPPLDAWPLERQIEAARLLLDGVPGAASPDALEAREPGQSSSRNMRPASA